MAARKPPTLQGAAAESRLAGLCTLRDTLAAAIPTAEGSALAALARQLRDVLRDIEELEKAAPKGSIVDDLARRRSTHGRAGTAGGKRAAAGPKPGAAGG